MAAEQELNVAEKTREHQVEIEVEISVVKQKAAKLKKGVTQKQQNMHQKATDR